MDSPKKKKVSRIENEGGAFTTVCMTADDFRKHLEEDEILTYIKDYFLNNKDENHVSNYIKAGGSVNEIANTLEKVDMKRREQTTVIFSALHLVVIKSITECSDSTQFEDECRQFVANYIGEMQSILVSNTIQKHKKAVLKLLASISVVSHRLASQILSTLTLSKEDLDVLTAHVDPNDEDSLRVSFIHFILSFIIDQSPKIIDKLLLKKVWLPSIFPELKYDLQFTVQLVLSTLEDKIINFVNISKTSKILAFNTQSLFNISELYAWNPKAWFDMKTHKTYTGTISDVDVANIRSWAHNLLLKVCTSSKYGIVFQDASYGVSNVQKNYTLSNFLQRIKEPWEDDLKKELIFKTLITCPDIVKPVLNSVGPNLKTFSSKWLEIIQFIKNILNNIKINLKDQSLKVCMDTIQDIVVPKQLLDSIKERKFLSAENITIRLNTMEFITNLLSNYYKLYDDIKILHSDASIQKSMTPYFINNLPSSMQLLECLSKSYENKEQDMINEIIKLFILYEKLCPTMIDIIRFDDSITKWIEEKSNCESPEDSSLILSLIRLEIIIYPHDPNQDKFLNRLKWTTFSQDDENKQIAIDILKELLDQSGLFIRSPNELNLWIYCIENFASDDIGALMASSLKWAFEHTNDVYKVLLKAQEQSTSEEASDLNLDDFLKVSANDDISGEANANSILQLSPLLPSVLKVLSKGQILIKKDDFLVAFIILTCHRQVSVTPYISLLKTYSCPTITKVMPYVESWLSQPIIIDVHPILGTLFSKASRFILKGKGDLEKVSLSTTLEAELLLEESIFMACELSRLCKATPDKLERVLNIVQHCFAHKELRVTPNHPALLSNFHPLRNVGDSNLTQLVQMIAEQTQTSPQFIHPYSHRLAFELKYAKKTVHTFEDKSKLLKLLKTFPFVPSDVEDLLNHIFSMKNKYFEIDGLLSPWATVTVHLLPVATDLKILTNEDKLISFVNLLTSLVNDTFSIYELSSTFLKYLKGVYSDISGAMLDSLTDFFYAECMSNDWNEEFCVYISSYLEKMDFNMISTDRSITLIASLENFNEKHAVFLSDSAGVIYQGLCERPSPKFLTDFRKIGTIISLETCKRLCKRIRKHPKDVNTSVESLDCIEMVFMKSEESYTLYSLALNWLTDSMNPNTFDHLQSEKICTILKKVLDSEIDKTALESATNDLVMSLLLQGLKLPSPPMLDLIGSLVKYNATKLPPGEIFDLLCSHSCFLDVLLSTNEAKNNILTLMLGLVDRDGSLINSNHVPVLLSSYNGTLSRVDQTTLKILQLYEKKGSINLACWKPYVWGEAAVDHYSVRSKISPNKANPTATLELFEKDKVQATITRFPLKRDLDTYFEEEDNGIYDPGFYLPLLSQLVGETTGGWKVASSGAIGLTLACLASSRERVRAAAYHILFRFYNFIPDNKDNMIWKHFIEALRGGIIGLDNGENVRLSSVVTTFLARASIIMSTPDDPLYFTLHNFVYAKPHLKLNTVPAFLEMFHSKRWNYRLHQYWLLEVIRDGIREQRDLQVTLNSLTFKFILDFHSCSLASIKAKELIEAIVIKCLQSIDEKQLLINNYSIIPWILFANPKMLNEIPTKIVNQYLPLKSFYLKDECT